MISKKIGEWGVQQQIFDKSMSDLQRIQSQLDESSDGPNPDDAPTGSILRGCRNSKRKASGKVKGLQEKAKDQLPDEDKEHGLAEKGGRNQVFQKGNGVLIQKMFTFQLARQLAFQIASELAFPLSVALLLSLVSSACGLNVIHNGTMVAHVKEPLTGFYTAPKVVTVEEPLPDWINTTLRCDCMLQPAFDVCRCFAWYLTSYGDTCTKEFIDTILQGGTLYLRPNNEKNRTHSPNFSLDKFGNILARPSQYLYICSYVYRAQTHPNLDYAEFVRSVILQKVSTTTTATSPAPTTPATSSATTTQHTPTVTETPTEDSNRVNCDMQNPAHQKVLMEKGQSFCIQIVANGNNTEMVRANECVLQMVFHDVNTPYTCNQPPDTKQQKCTFIKGGFNGECRHVGSYENGNQICIDQVEEPLEICARLRRPGPGPVQERSFTVAIYKTSPGSNCIQPYILAIAVAVAVIAVAVIAIVVDVIGYLAYRYPKMRNCWRNRSGKGKKQTTNSSSSLSGTGQNQPSNSLLPPTFEKLSQMEEDKDKQAMANGGPSTHGLV